MGQTPPPPPGAASGGTTRPSLVTAAAVLLFVGGGFGVLGGLLALFGGGWFGGVLGGAVAVFGIIVLAISALQIWAGVQILNLREAGRILGIVLSAIGALLALGQLGGSAGGGVLSLAINGFVIYALITTQSYFRK